MSLRFIECLVLKHLSIYFGLPRTAYILALCRVISGSGNFIFPFLTLLLTQKVGMSASQTGLIIFLSSLAYVPGSLIGGKLADKFGRKPVMVTAELLVAASWISCGFFPHSFWIVPFISFSYFALGALEPVQGAVAADISTPENRKAIYSLGYLGWNIGFAIGPLVAGLLFENYAHWMFWGDGIAILVAVVLVVLWIPESRPKHQDEAHTDLESAKAGTVWPIIWARPHLMLFTLAGVFSTLVYAQIGFSLPLQMQEVFGSEGSKFYGQLMGFTGLTVVLFTAPMVALTKSLKPIVIIAMGMILFALGFAPLGMVQWLPWFFMAAFVFTLGEILEATNRGVYIANHSPMSHRARINSIVPLIIGVGHAFAPLITGPFIDNYGVSNVWPIAGCFSIISFCLLLLLVWREDHWVDRLRRNQGETESEPEPSK